ncbi:MAG TPA: helix-turn-helix transcriptional regulator [Pseudolabrys sp.]|nr:helix-turn-helix transcriptional regulator [Pseudolabrys sp.]
MVSGVIRFVPAAKLPNRIRELRKQRGWSLQALGELVGCSLQMIGQLERGDSTLTLPWMRRIATAMGVKPADVLLPEDNSASLTVDEQLWIAALRAADSDAREQLTKVRDALLVEAIKQRA